MDNTNQGSTNQAFRTMLVPAEQVVLARSICSAVAPSGGSGMFSTGLSPTGEPPASFYVSTGYLDEQFALLMPLKDYSTGTETTTATILSSGYVDSVVTLCQQAGFSTTAEEVALLFATSDVTTEEPFSAFARLGLNLVQENT